ncbi:hypothetical protein BWI17_14590 [Betaproteobacteria bacterium GR16-43]|nr:hypothetical protein BWI17_14590 [Betaproteobacteria bacterium GR16-43]
MQGTFVIAFTRIQGADLVGSRSSCVDLEVVQTDDQGRYRVTRGTALNADRIIMAYAPGLEAEFDPDSVTGKRMKRYVGTDEARAASFSKYSSLLTCGPYREVREKLLPLFKALDEEHAKLKIDRRFGAPNPFTSKIRSLDSLEASEK